MNKFLTYLQKYIFLWVLFVVVLSSLIITFREFSFTPRARIIFIDVGQGDAILIVTPHGRKILIDAGKYDNIVEKLDRYIPFSQRSLDLLIATHPDIDHIAGMYSLLDEYRIEHFLHPNLLVGEPIYRSIAKKLRSQNIPSQKVFAGEKIYLDKGMYLETLSPYRGKKINDANEASLVFLLEYQGKKILLTGDAPQSVEQDLVKMYGGKLQSYILKLGHHGSKSSSSEAFLEEVHPHYAIISAGCHNSYGHPNASVLNRLAQLHIVDVSTCESGDIVFEFRSNEWVLQE